VGFYEVGVYMAIIVVASICVFGIMWLLMKSMQPKRPKGRKRPALAAAVAGQSSKTVAQEPAGKGKDKKSKKEKKKKSSKNDEEKLLKLKDMSDSRLLSQGETAAASKDKPKKAKENEAAESQVQSPAPAEGENKEAAAQEPVADAAADQGPMVDENGEVILAELPSMDTLTEEEEAPKEAEIDLMSVFESEDAEDSSTADLAANLFDVDVQNIEKLGSEVSEFLNGMRSR
jgi:hypothetical protein